MQEDSATSYGDFATIWERAQDIPGWLTEKQAQALWALASTVPVGSSALEIGSHQGRSTVVLAAALQARGGRLVAVDPFVEGRLFGGRSTRDRFEANISAAGLAGAVDLIPERSTELRPTWSEPLALLYIDGKHDYWTVSDDLRWARHLPSGGAVAIHDAFSSVGVTLGLLAHVLGSRELRYVRRTGSLAELRLEPPGRLDRARLLGQLPWFARNLVVKVALRVLRPFGVRRADPY